MEKLIKVRYKVAKKKNHLHAPEISTKKYGLVPKIIEPWVPDLYSIIVNIGKTYTYFLKHNELYLHADYATIIESVYPHNIQYI